MKKSWRLLLPFFAVLIIAQGCSDCPDCNPQKVTVIREKPTSLARVVGTGGTAGKIRLNEWHAVLVVSVSDSAPGSFISAVVSKKGGSGGAYPGEVKTTVRLIMDRKEVAIKSFEVARAMGLSQQNYSGVVWLDGEDNIETLVLGYQEPLYFSGTLELSIMVDDPQVEKVFLQVTYTKQDTGDDEGTGGGDRAPPFP